jgi:hypothetical protein
VPLRTQKLKTKKIKKTLDFLVSRATWETKNEKQKKREIVA